MKGAFASLARRRAISVLPTPVGPIMRMFFGTISWRRGSGTCCWRQRLRSATATERLARSCPTMCLSSSETISPGVIFRADIAIGGRREPVGNLQGFHDVVLVSVDTQIAGNGERLADDLFRREFGVLQQRQRGGLC